MHLFKSPGLHEPPRPAAKTYRDGGFGRRYGRRGACRLDLSVASNDGDGDFEYEAERHVLRMMADYDRAA